MKLKEVNEKANELAKLGQKTFPSKMGYAISYNYEKLVKELERIEKERIKLCKQYADKDEEGNPVMDKSVIDGKETSSYHMTDENRKVFNEEYNELLDSETNIEFRKLNMEIVERCETVERYDIPTVSEMYAMSFMLEE